MKSMIKIDNITKSYLENKVLDNLSIDIKEGEIISIIGPSGSGKSTFLRTLNKLEDIDTGTIFIDNQNIQEKNYKINELKYTIGMVFQNYNLFPHLSILDNMTLAPILVNKDNKKDIEEEALKLLDRIGLKDKKDAMPYELSGGQKQRVAIMRIILMKPKIILFDEPTSALDPELVNEVLQLIKELSFNKRITMIIVTHEIEFAKSISDKIGLFKNGKIDIFEEPDKFFKEEIVLKFIDKNNK